MPLNSFKMKDIFMKAFQTVLLMAIQKKFATQSHSNELLKLKEMNKRIIAFGKENKWRNIISLYHKNKSEMTIVNIATIYSQLSRINSVIKKDLEFVHFLDKTINKVKTKELQETVDRIFTKNSLYTFATCQLSSKTYSLK
jgi:hypothetical protein